MAHDLEFLADLQDEGLLASEIDIEHIHGNESLVGEDNLQRYSDLAHNRCSVNQSRLAGWAWLIGGSQGGALQPLLCIARKRDTCDGHPRLFGLHGIEVIHVFTCLLVIANLFMMAVWFRCKAAPNKREVVTQLFILRTFCVLEVVGALSSMFQLRWLFIERFSVVSALHSILLAGFFNLVATVLPLCFHLATVLDFLTAIFLVEHSHPAQRVLLFASLRRAQVLFAAALPVCLAACIGLFFSTGFVYCVTGGSAYLLNESYMRISIRFLRFHWLASTILHVVFIPLTFILLIVYVSKRCCECCRGSPSPDRTSGSVIYVPQRDEDIEEETAEPEPSVVIEQGPSVPLGSELVDELMRVIFWQRTLYFILLIGCLVAGVAAALVPRRTVVYILYFTIFFVYHVVQFGRLTILSPIISPTYRRGFVSIFVELRDAVTGFIHRSRNRFAIH